MSVGWNGTQRLQHFHFLVAQRAGIKRIRRLHRREGQQLQQVILQHVAAHAGGVVIARARFHAHRLGHRDLHVIDVVAIPDRLEDGVGKAEDDQVLHGFFAQIVIDAIDLFFGKDVMHLLIQRHGRLQIAPEGFLDDEARPAVFAVIQSRFAEMTHDGGIRFRRRGEIEQAIIGGGRAQSIEQLAQTRIAVGLIKFRSVIVQVRGKLIPRRRIERDAAELLHAVPHFGAKRFVGPVAPRKADDVALLWQQALLRQRVERRQDLAMRQIAGRAEDDDGKW